MNGAELMIASTPRSRGERWSPLLRPLQGEPPAPDGWCEQVIDLSQRHPDHAWCDGSLFGGAWRRRSWDRRRVCSWIEWALPEDPEGWSCCIWLRWMHALKARGEVPVLVYVTWLGTVSRQFPVRSRWWLLPLRALSWAATSPVYEAGLRKWGAEEPARDLVASIPVKGVLPGVAWDDWERLDLAFEAQGLREWRELLHHPRRT